MNRIRLHLKQHLRGGGVLAVALCSTLVLPATGQWRFGHADNGNSGFAAINTRPGETYSIRWAGSIAPGVNPVVGPDGSVYVGTTEGIVRAWKADGTPYWTRQINYEHGGFYGSPVVGRDGSIYLVSSVHSPDSPNDGNAMYLHKFNSGGAWLFWKQIPRSQLYPFTDGGLTNAPLNLWEANGLEVVMLPVRYQGLGRESIDLMALSTQSGYLLGRTSVNVEVYEITGSTSFQDYLPYCLALNIWNLEVGCYITALVAEPGFDSPAGPPPPFPGAGFPMPGVAMLPNPGRGTGPGIAVSDRKHVKAIYTFSLEGGFTRVFHLSNPKLRYTTGTLQTPIGGVTGTAEGALTRTGTNLLEQPAQTALGMLTATPTRLKDGSWLVVSREGHVTRLATSGRVTLTPGGESIASAAASCTHIFVSTTEGFFTYDANTLQQVAVVPWRDAGGLSAPVIGLKGEVYLITGQYLFVFNGPSGAPSSSGCTGSR